MIKNVQYKGYTASPSDYECTDGELDMSLNMIYEGGLLKPILPPKLSMTVPENYIVKCIHKTSNYLHYVMIGINNHLKFKKDYEVDGILYRPTLIFEFPIDTEIYQITPVGNTLIVLTSDGIYYFLWKENKYICLGNALPELNVSPYINTNIKTMSSIEQEYKIVNSDTNGIISGDSMIPTTICEKLYNDEINSVLLSGIERQNIYDKVFSILNFYSDFLKKEGYFLAPFYVRFAYRMYDGSHVKHTVPVLLSPTTLGKPLMDVKIHKESALFNPLFPVSNLYATILLPSNIDDWKDIITDIDVFVTEPLVDYTDNPESLLSIKKYSWAENGNEDLSPYMMVTNKTKTGRVKTSQWVSIQEFIDDNKDAKLYYDIYPFYNISFRRNTSWGNWHTGWCKFKSDYSGLDGYFAIENKGYTISASTEDGIKIVGMTELKDFSTDLSLTFFKIEDVKGVSIFYTEEKIDDKIEFNTYLILNHVFLDTNYCIETTRVDDKSYGEILTSCNSFYNVSSISLLGINDGYFNDLIPLKNNVLRNITTRQTLSDVGQCHNNMITNSSFNYNSRINIVLDKEQIKNPSTSLRMQNPATCKSSRIQYDEYTFSTERLIYAYVEIFENDQRVCVEIPIGDYSNVEGFQISELKCFSFPHNNAKNLILYSCLSIVNGMNTSHEYRKFVIPLKRHDFLNLSYAFNNFKSIIDEQNYDVVDGEDDVKMPISNNTIEYGNIIRLSDVNNPFRFSEEYTVSLPVTKIYALSTAAKALSQGQFGQYPLYAFTSEGIWALELTSTGTYSARQPISRDVVINPDSITQIDNSVLFATDRGIMLINGSQVICISDKINSMDLFALQELPKADRLVYIYKGIGANVTSMDDIALLPFNEFLKECRMVYDYSHQRIIVYNPNVKYAYVYSLNSQQWGMVLSDITYGVNSFPEALAANGNNIVDFSKTGSEVAAAMIVTRPLDMEHADIFKTIREIFQRGNMKNAKANQVLYGSNDLNNWFLVWSSDNMHMGGFGGSPWKYYRIVMIREFDKSESIYGFSVQYDTRLTNRLR